VVRTDVRTHVRWRRGGLIGFFKRRLPYNFVTRYDEVIVIENVWKLYKLNNNALVSDGD
jgi:hypothetical protein